MFDQILELSRKAVESSLQMQQVMFKQLTQNCVATSPSAGISADWGGTMRKRCAELTIEAFQKHRASLDSTYKAGIQMIEEASRVSEAKSTEDCVRTAENVWRKSFDALKGQAEAQFREFQTLAEKSFEMANNTNNNKADA
jgi:hypothetical protein